MTKRKTTVRGWPRSVRVFTVRESDWRRIQKFLKESKRAH